MVPSREPFDDEPVHVATGEADPHACARCRGLGELRRHRILEGAVQMGEAAVDDDRGDRCEVRLARTFGRDHPLNLARTADTGSTWRASAVGQRSSIEAT